jgi:hypothetical protein
MKQTLCQNEVSMNRNAALLLRLLPLHLLHYLNVAVQAKLLAMAGSLP